MCRRAYTEWLGVHTSHIILPIPIYRDSLVGQRIPVICIIYNIIIYMYSCHRGSRDSVVAEARVCVCVVIFYSN